MICKIRRYGLGPHTIVAVHGGPGAIGEASPFARVLSGKAGVVEPLLDAKRLNGQVKQLKYTIEKYADKPAILVGHSYGAMLSLIVAAKFPDLVQKTVLISSGVLSHGLDEAINRKRNLRISQTQKNKIAQTKYLYKISTGKKKVQKFIELMSLIQSADAYNLIPHQSDIVEAEAVPELYDAVWEEVKSIRDSGKLLKLTNDIKCPVTAIHGDYDPRPAENIRLDLRTHINNLEFFILNNCGHYPWYETEACEEFRSLLLDQVSVD